MWESARIELKASTRIEILARVEWWHLKLVTEGSYMLWRWEIVESISVEIACPLSRPECVEDLNLTSVKSTRRYH
jgi:hypothetical protein